MTETYDHILETAMRLFARKGFKDTSIADIVAASGLSKGGIYWHFKSKEEIITAVYRQLFEAQAAFIVEMLSSEGSASDRLRQIALFVENSLTDAFPQPLDIYAYAIRKPDLLAQLIDYFENYQAQLADLIRQGIDDGEFAISDPEQAAFVLLSSMEGIILICSMMGKPLGKSISAQIELILRGMQ